MTNVKPYPMKMLPSPHGAVWGGDRLKKIFNKKAPFDRIAESWELSARRNEESIVENGALAGISFREYLSAFGGTDSFPLLIKFIDSAAPLSVQVHPSISNDNIEAKTEMWYIIDASPDASIVYGLRDGVSLEDFSRSCIRRDDGIEEMLNYIPVHPGDTVFIPAGQIHSIGAGILLLEVQQNSDTTYRLYDYGRIDENGNSRELHIEDAISSAKLFSNDEICKIRFSALPTSAESFADIFKGPSELICDCEFFRVIKHKGTALFFRSRFGKALICTKGSSELICDGINYGIHQGDTYYIPGGCDNVMLTDGAEVLSVVSK